MRKLGKDLAIALAPIATGLGLAAWIHRRECDHNHTQTSYPSIP